MNNPQQVVGRNAEHRTDLRHSVAGDRLSAPPVENSRARNAKHLAQLGGASSALDQRIDGDGTLGVHGLNGRTFRRVVSRALVGFADTLKSLTVQTAPMGDSKTSGRRVRELREAEGLVQEELAAIIGVSRSTIAGIETGGDRGGIVTMVAIADHYKVPLDWLLGRKVPPGGPPVGQFVDSPDKLAWLQFWDSLDAADRRAVLRMLRIPFPNEVA